MPAWPPSPPTPTTALGRRPVRRKANGDEYHLPGVVHYLWVIGLVIAGGIGATRLLG